MYSCLVLIRAYVHDLPGLNIENQSDVPIGVDLSSSAALEVATLRCLRCLRCLRSLIGLTLDDVALAKLAQRAEIEYVGVHCGIMDQMASSLAST